MKSKRVPLMSTSIIMHNMVSHLAQLDRFELSAPSTDMRFMSLAQAQALLDLHPIPVTLPTDADSPSSAQYCSLMPTPIIEQLRFHVDANSLMLTVLIYPEENLDERILGFLLFEPAFVMTNRMHHPRNIHHRIEQAKHLNLAPPNKKQLATIASCSPTAFRS
ncbi:hypothetical protein HC723_13280 [Vibrio sp. S11_S32]|uniref:hypothetical protein n=1 Tax=Vibrio sp. S11_S32 TaxID=2720225 RepID=UPI0016802352|nr:hypothetical protein [Vibrio sp. S11_S32]MBD1577401.1 hypothetical protein [Vibrio sp. S11_S32]